VSPAGRARVDRYGRKALALCPTSVAVGLLVTLGACAPETRYHILGTFVDGVPSYEEWLHPKPEERPKPGVQEVHYRQIELSRRLVVQPNLQQFFVGERPAIEKLKTWEQVLEALPSSHAGGPDWSAALAKGVIAPVTSLQPGQSGLEELPLDVTLKGPMPVTFPHAPHTRWLACDNCHTGIFEMAAGTAEVTMKDIDSGKYCGVCHGKVAFGTAAQCGRCHVALEELPLDVALKGDMGVKFPHAPHTRWLPCESCHTEIFPMAGGQTTITMADIAKGKYCGTCHGSLTFGPKECGRCHARREELPLDVTLKGNMGVKFPHAPHTRWLPCESCHTKIFPMAGGQTTITMADIAKGKYCGTCHGKIVFATTECGRCHEPRAELALDVSLKGVMPVTFPHAPHTRWLPCESCHTKLFPMAAGTTEITMDGLSKGKYCGACHGSMAFAISECTRCHPEMAQ
jgi:c(7)-type cytochrome triheme protein